MIAAALVVALLAQVAQPAVQSPDEEAVREAVRAYYEVQTKKDPDKAAAFWSAAANPRMSREAFVAMFGAGEAEYTADVQSVTIKGTDARVRVSVTIARTIVRNDLPTIARMTQLFSQVWRKEGAGWKLLREGTVADEIADDLIAATPAERPALYETHRQYLTQARLAISQRATMAITLTKDYVRGKELFELALEVAALANDRHGQANSHHNIAQAWYFLGQHEAATASYEKELALGREIPSDDVSAAALFGLATVAYSRAEYTRAVGFYRDALAIYEKKDDGGAIGRALVSIGNVEYLQADYDAAIASYRRGLDLLVAARDSLGAGFARSGLARVFAAQGDLVASLQMYEPVLEDARRAASADPRARFAPAGPLESMGEVYFRMGNLDMARTAFAEARSLLTEPGDVGRLSGNLGLTELVAGRFDAALANYTDSRDKYVKASDAPSIGRAWIGIGFSHAAREKWTEAMTAYNTAIKLFEDQKLVEDAARARLGLSLAQSGAGEHMAALVSARRVGADAVTVGSDDLVWRAAVRAGEALRKLDRLADARVEFDRAVAAIDTLAAAAPANPEARAQLDDSASAWTGLAFIAAAARDSRGALAAVEARRAHIRRTQLAGFQRDITRGMTAEEQADEQAIVRELISTRAQLRAERNLPHPDQARIDKLQQQLTTLLSRRADQQAKLYARLPELQYWRGLKPPADDLFAAVPADFRSIVVEYLAEDDELLVVTIARGEQGPDVTAVLAPLERKELSEQIAQALQPAAIKDPSEWRTRAAPLAAALIAPIALRLADRDRIIVIPDDLLWKVPFEALPLGDGTLGARVRVGYATSLATLVLQQRAAEVPGTSGARHLSGSVAVFAAPEIPATVRAQLALAHTGWKPPDEEASLKAATEQVRAYGETAAVTSKADASEAAARAALGTADALQFSGPVHVSGASPLFSMIVLAGTGDAPDNDGRWELREWFRGSSHARVAILADGSAFGGAGAGSAMDAFAWAAAAAGIPTLAIGRWPADGFSTDVVLAEFHRGLAKGLAPAEAWSAVVSPRMTAGEPPAAWAGLRLIGPGR